MNQNTCSKYRTYVPLSQEHGTTRLLEPPVETAARALNDLCQCDARLLAAREAPAGGGWTPLSENFPVPGGLAPGSRLAGYRVEEPLGADGTVVVSGHAMSGWTRLVALKVLAPPLAADEEFRQRFTTAGRCTLQADLPVMENRRKGVEESRTSPERRRCARRLSAGLITLR